MNTPSKGAIRPNSTTTQNQAPLDLYALSASFLLDDMQTAAILNVTTGTLSVWRATGRYSLKYIKVGRKVRYKAGDLREFLESRTKTHSGE